MAIGDDLTDDALATALPDNEVRAYPAVLSTESVALAWARDGAPHGSVVTAGYQVSPRGRGGLPWTVDPERDVCFSLVLRPELHAAREGWIYAVAVAALADLRGGPRITWPDEVHTARGRAGAVGAWVELGPHGVRWAVLTVLLPGVDVARAAELARAVRAIEHRLAADPADVLADYRPRCDTLGRKVCARMIPLGPAGPRIEGTAADVLADGSLAIRTDQGKRIAIRPQNLGVLDVS
ncbi:hypothetical protein [Haloechinothrix halophila]|uniref:hypothetical protein n=1 Tax=Haloechinothrix halophila TaxID=1069073 RepID=UPI00041C6691|nr:hypothetical protein [Haloechinothrix halophila]